jgi:hypothetical protein
MQLALYMLMLGCDVGDLVQYQVPHANAPPSLTITRLPLHGDPARGCIDLAHDWHVHLLPRLYAYVRCIYRLRAEEGARRRWLAMGSEGERWAFLQEYLPHLQGCPLPHNVAAAPARRARGRRAKQEGGKVEAKECGERRKGDVLAEGAPTPDKPCRRRRPSTSPVVQCIGTPRRQLRSAKAGHVGTPLVGEQCAHQAHICRSA